MPLNNKTVFLSLLWAFYTSFAWGQATLKGSVWANEDNKKIPLNGATVYWSGKPQMAVSTGIDGLFSIKRQPADSSLIVSFVGYSTDTLMVMASIKTIDVLLLPDAKSLEGVVVNAKTAQSDAIERKEQITLQDLRKAACCNLAESFETNATVDVSSMDALTGTKQLRMLGLDGVYTQILTENVPSLRGLAARSGLKMIPGPWIKAIDITKGVGSVVYGYESLAGQMNINLYAPEHIEKLHLNGYMSLGRAEANATYSYNFSKKFSATTMAHLSSNYWRQDKNNDGFYDVPIGSQYNVIQRFRFQTDRFVSQTLIHGILDNNQSGDIRAFESGASADEVYHVDLKQKRLQVFSKNAILSKKSEEQSLGIIASGTWHYSENSFGKRRFDAEQSTAMLNVIFQTCFGRGKLLRLGASAMRDNLGQILFGDSMMISLDRLEQVAGVFGEFTRSTDRYGMVLGLRTDYHNLKGLIWTPRLHFRYNLNAQNTLLFTAGRGFRYANLLADNMSYLISGRKVILPENPLLEEDAWNFGANWTHTFVFNSDSKSAKLTIDFYHTRFSSQAVLDIETKQLLRIYALSGLSRANSLQMNLDMKLHPRFGVALAYKYYDLLTTYRDAGRRELPFVAPHRALINLAYTSQNRRWLYDLTLNGYNSKRLPLSAEHTSPERSPAFVLMSAQATRKFRGNLEIYVGGENLLNVMQHDLIVASERPFSQDFDAARVWGPNMGAMVYVGVRWTLTRHTDETDECH